MNAMDWLEVLVIIWVAIIALGAAGLAALAVRGLWWLARRVCGYQRPYRLPDHYRADLYLKAARTAWRDRAQAQAIERRARAWITAWSRSAEAGQRAAAADLDAALDGRPPMPLDVETVALRKLEGGLAADGVHLPAGGDR